MKKSAISFFLIALAIISTVFSQQFYQKGSFNFGAETGYKYQPDKPVVINSKILFTSPFRHLKIIPGLEFLVGYSIEV